VKKIFGTLLLLMLVAVFVMGDLASAEPANNAIYSNNPILAVVDGEPIRADDIKNIKIHEALERVYEMQDRALKQKVLQKLMKNHPELQADKLPDVSSEDIAMFYDKTPGVKKMGSPEKMKEEIRQYLERLNKEAYLDSKYQMAVEKGWVVDYLKSPNDFMLVAKTSHSALFFEEKADKPRKVFLLEYSDFQCPFCKRVQATLGKLRHDYGDKVQFGYRHFPLPFHKEAKDLAEAVECAKDQGKFWELQSHWYELTGTVKRRDMARNAEKVGVKDVKAFQACMDKNKYRDKVEKDISEGAKMGIEGTPSFIVGLYNTKAGTVTGEMFSGAAPEEEFVRKINKYIALSEQGDSLNTATVNK
jgi:protein-disulfide isomerase